MLKNLKGSLLQMLQVKCSWAYLQQASGPRCANSVQLLGVFEYCKKEYLTLWSRLLFSALDMAPAYAIPGLFFCSTWRTRYFWTQRLISMTSEDLTFSSKMKKFNRMLEKNLRFNLFPKCHVLWIFLHELEDWNRCSLLLSIVLPPNIFRSSSHCQCSVITAREMILVAVFRTKRVDYSHGFSSVFFLIVWTHEVSKIVLP